MFPGLYNCKYRWSNLLCRDTVAIKNLPTLGASAPSKHLKRTDSSLSTTVQIPKGIPVATFMIGEIDAANEGLFTVSLSALSNPEMAASRLNDLRKTQADKINGMILPELE